MAEQLRIKKSATTAPRTKNERTRSIRLVNFETGESVSILAGLGGTVRELVLRCGGKHFSLLEYPQSTSEMLENKHFHGVKLIPFPGRVIDGKYEFDGRAHQLDLQPGTPNAIHGFFSQVPYRLLKTIVGDHAASVVLSASHSGRTRGFPFRFEVRLTYRLEEGSFTCTTEIRNKDSKAIPIGDGWHPYFRTSGPVKRLTLSLPPHSVVEVTPVKVPTGEMRKRTAHRTLIPLTTKNLDSVFDFGMKKQVVTTNVIDKKNGLDLQVWQESGAGRYRYLVLYRPTTGTSIAIEPWTCAPNALNNGMGLIVLKPGRTFKASYGVRLRKLRRTP